MENIVYKNHETEINQLINLLLDNKIQIVLYNSHEGYGDTAFIQRVMYLLHATPTYQILHAELSPSEQNPLHKVTSNIVAKKGKLYQRLQFFSDEQNCSQEIPIILTSVIKDITQSETIATLFSPQKSIPIYAGFYQDRLKQNFFDLVHIITKQQRVLFFIDNIQFMDNDSFYELQALLQNPQITLVLFKSGEGIFFDKFYDEFKYKFSEIELTFPEPDINYVQKLATLYNKTLSEYEAASILSENKRNIRKILCNMRKPEISNSNLMLEDQILKIIILYNDYITQQELFQICAYTPYEGIVSEDEISKCIKNIENKGLLQSVTILETRETQYRPVSYIDISIDIADKIVISRALSDYYNHCEDLDYKHLCQAWNINASLNLGNRNKKLTHKILLQALKMGYKVPDEILLYAKQQNDVESKILSATFLFCNANYLQAKNLLEDILVFNNHRSLKVMYAISLNRCRNHELAELKLSRLIESSHSIDEKAILVSFLISNCVHSRKLNTAKSLYKKYEDELKTSKKYPYFLRNAATVFDALTAYQLRNTALKYFNDSNDFFGYYSTTINMTHYFLLHNPIEYTISVIQKAFNELQQYNANQIHLAANNLGVCYLFAQDDLNALKYLSLCFEKAQSIMPKGYAAINISAIFLQKKQYRKAHGYLDIISNEIRESKLARLKAHYYQQCAFDQYACGNFKQANAAIINTNKYCSITENPTIYKTINLIKNNIKNNIIYDEKMFSFMFVPCFLEYWTINSIDVLSEDFLPM
jgi:hypothetical protein